MGCNKKWEINSTAFQTIDREDVRFNNEREAFPFDLSESKVALDMIQSQQICSKLFIKWWGILPSLQKSYSKPSYWHFC